MLRPAEEIAPLDTSPSLTSSRNLRLEVFRHLDELSPLRPAWDELLAHYPPATTFSSWEWLSCWWQSFGARRKLLVLALFNGISLVGLAPLSISQERIGWFTLRVLRLMGDGSADSDNLDFPVRPEFAKVFADAILRYLAEQRPRWDICLLNTVPSNSLVAQHLKKTLGSPPWMHFEYLSPASQISLPESWEQYTETLSSEDRKNLIRYSRRLEARHSTRIYRCDDACQLRVVLEALFRLHQARWQSASQPGAFSSPERCAFYERLAHCLLQRKCLELWVLELGGEIAAVQFAFRYGDKVFQLQEGYDHRRSSDRPGFVLRGQVLEQLIAERIQRYDFLGGEDPYKRRWGAHDGHYRQLHFALKFGSGALCLQMVDKAARSKGWLREKLPGSVWNVLHNVNLAARGRLSAALENDQVLL